MGDVIGRGNFRAGVSTIDISPKKGLELAGYPHYPRYNTGVHDPLYASCMYLDNGNTKVAIVAMDLLFFSKKHVKEVRQRICEQTGIPERNIMISCSHTHSGPWASGRLDIESLLNGAMQDVNYIAELNQKIVSLVFDASNNVFDARIGATKASCGREQGVGGNRRDPKGVCDTDVCVMVVEDLNGSARGIYVNYALHPTVIHADSTLVSADYPAYIRKYLTNKEPQAVVLFSQGASGDQSTRYFRHGQTFEEAERIGVAIAAKAYQAFKDIKYVSDIEIYVKSVEMDIDIRKLPKKQEMMKRVEAAKQKYAQIKEKDMPYLQQQNANLRLLGAEDLLGYIIMLEKGSTIALLEEEKPAEVQVIGIGDIRIVGLPGEYFVEYSKYIKQASQFKNTFVNTVTNGCLPGYVYTKDALKEGGYETDTSLIDENFGLKIVEVAVELLDNGILRKG